MDGITGIYGPGDAELVQKVFLATGALQHRGKTGAGIAVARLPHASDVDDVAAVRIEAHALERQLLAAGGIGHVDGGLVRVADEADGLGEVRELGLGVEPVEKVCPIARGRRRRRWGPRRRPTD